MRDSGLALKPETTGAQGCLASGRFPDENGSYFYLSQLVKAEGLGEGRGVRVKLKCVRKTRQFGRYGDLAWSPLAKKYKYY